MIGSHVDNHHWCDYVSLVTSLKYAWIIRITLSQKEAATEQWQIFRKEEINLRNASYDIVDSGAGLRPCVQPFGSESRAQLVSARWRGFLVGQSESRLRGAARRDFASCVSYLRFNPRHGTVPPPLPTASRGNACPYALSPSSSLPPSPSRSFSFTPFLRHSHSFIRELYKGSDGHSIFPLAEFPNRTLRRT